MYELCKKGIVIFNSKYFLILKYSNFIVKLNLIVVAVSLSTIKEIILNLFSLISMFKFWLVLPKYIFDFVYITIYFNKIWFLIFIDPPKM